jgi:hypothetical protein
MRQQTYSLYDGFIDLENLFYKADKAGNSLISDDDIIIGWNDGVFLEGHYNNDLWDMTPLALPLPATTERRIQTMKIRW